MMFSIDPEVSDWEIREGTAVSFIGIFQYIDPILDTSNFDLVSQLSIVQLEIGSSSPDSPGVLQQQNWYQAHAELQVSEVPIPSVTWLFGASLIGLLGFKNKISRKTSKSVPLNHNIPLPL